MMPLRIIPVIDLMDGQVVHARYGRREHYQPLSSTLCDTCEPLHVAHALMRLHPFGTLYIADLDAIMGRGGNQRPVESIRRHYPDLTLWLDAGSRDIRALCPDDHVRPVIGSESQPDPRSFLRNRDALLSLDFRNDAFLGPPELLADPALWPDQVIVMSLAKVGSRRGPDIARLRRLMALSRATAWYAGGGVRHANDLRALSDMALSGALIATGLHSGAIGAPELAKYG